MMWLKYSDRPILNGEQWDRDQPASGSRLSRYAKPVGFWITDDSEDCWRTWCINENFRLDELTHKHEIILDESDILIIRNAAELERFNQEFSVVEIEPGTLFRDSYIIWREVARRYSGIIITPYQWQYRLNEDFCWYYVWDCAGGCIWKASAIREIRLIEIDLSLAEKSEAA